MSEYQPALSFVASGILERSHLGQVFAKPSVAIVSMMRKKASRIDKKRTLWNLEHQFGSIFVETRFPCSFLACEPCWNLKRDRLTMKIFRRVLMVIVV